LLNSDFQHSVRDESFRPDAGEELFLGDELSGTFDELVKDCVSFGPELDYFRSSPETLVRSVQAKWIENYAVFTPVHVGYSPSLLKESL
jgi:hypothetical protein